LSPLQRPARLRFLSHRLHDQADQVWSSSEIRETSFQAHGEEDTEEGRKEVTKERFRELVEEAIDSIPERFARHVRNVGFIIEDEPSDALLDEMEIEDGGTLMGLYHGTPLTERHWDYGNQLPDRILLFQSPIEDDGDGGEDDVFSAIGETLIHELGHYFGMTEEEIDVVEEMWRKDQFDEDGGDESA